MNFTVGYTIFNKENLIEKLVQGVAKLDGVPSIFLFDGCTDDSVENFLNYRVQLEHCKAFVNEGYDRFETCSNNFILKQIETDCCMLMQDDLILTNDEIFQLAEEIYINDISAGLIGFKDGYEMDVVNQYKDFVSAPWSTSKNRNKVLKRGEYCNRTYVNRGPLCVPRKLISRIGYFDEAFYPLFWDDNDYSIRSAVAGFNNYVAYSEIETDLAWGATRGISKIPYKDIYIANQYRFGKKWNLLLPKMSRYRLLKGVLKSKGMKFRKWIEEQKREVLFQEI